MRFNGQTTRPSGRVFAFPRAAGFTLVELVVTILLMAILAATAMPRFFGAGAFHEMGYADAAAAAARYAQKLAMNSGCDTRFLLNAGGYALSQRAAGCSSGAFTRAVQRAGGGDWSNAAPAGVSIGSLDVYFDAQGQPFVTSSDTLVTAPVDGAVGTRTVRIEPYTGLVYLP